MLSLFNASVRDIHTTNAIVGMALFVGGLAQFCAGMWEFANANTFGATGVCLFPAPGRAFAAALIDGVRIHTR